MMESFAKEQSTPGDLRLEQAGDGLCLYPSGDWTLAHYLPLKRAIVTLGPQEPTTISFTELGALDTAGVALLARLLGTERLGSLAGSVTELSDAQRALLQIVAEAMARPVPSRPEPGNPLLARLAWLGKLMESGWHNLLLLLGFIGMTLATLLRLLPKPHRWRITALVNQMHQTGLDAVPIVALLTFMVGAVVAFLGSTVLANFGATIYTVDLVVYSFLREFGVLLTAILLAGRTASAFTAQLGSMKVNEELDALRAQGLDPIELLVVPRMLALLFVLPLLTIIAMLSGICGGAAVALLSLDIPLLRFITIVQKVSLQHYLVGMAKAPLFALLIAQIGCLEGFKVEGSARSVGAHTTSSVVQSIFAVILLDALAALFLMEINW